MNESENEIRNAIFQPRFVKSMNPIGTCNHSIGKVAEFHLRDLRVLFDYSGV